MNEEPFYTGNVEMRAYQMSSDSFQFYRLLERASMSQGTKEGRNEIRKFVHRHLCLGHMVVTKPV